MALATHRRSETRPRNVRGWRRAEDGQHQSRRLSTGQWRQATALCREERARAPRSRQGPASSWHDHIAAVDEAALLLEGEFVEPAVHPVECDRTRDKVGRLGNNRALDAQRRQRTLTAALAQRRRNCRRRCLRKLRRLRTLHRALVHVPAPRNAQRRGTRAEVATPAETVYACQRRR
eukprot:4402785-Pleurochrysis_carterae.AAC.5